MKKIFIRFVLLLSFFSMSAFAQTMIDSSQPDTLIKTVTQTVLDKLKSDPSLRQGDVKTVTRFVEQYILPYTDFNFTTQLVMGAGWRKATPQQREALVDEFKTLLIRTYSGALSQVNPDQKIQFRPYRGSRNGVDAVVRSVVNKNGEPVQLDYRLRKTPQGWRVYDLNVLGVWLIQTYQQQFREKIQQSGIDGLIAFLKQRNQQFLSKKTTK